MKCRHWDVNVLRKNRSPSNLIFVRSKTPPLFRHYMYCEHSRLVNPLNAELNPICHLLALLGGATIVVVSRLRVNGTKCDFRWCLRSFKLYVLFPEDGDGIVLRNYAVIAVLQPSSA